MSTWRNFGMAWARLSLNSQQSHNTLFIQSIYCFIYEIPYLYLYRLDFHYCSKYTSLQLCMGTHSFFPFAQCQVSSFILYSCGFFFFLSLAAKLHIYLCKCNFYEKVFLYEENQNFVMIFINTKRSVSSMAEWWYSRPVVQETFLHIRQSRHTHKNPSHPRAQGAPSSMEQIHTN